MSTIRSQVTASRSLTWEEASSKIEEAFRRLPVWQPSAEDKVEGIPYETLIPGIPRQLLNFRPTGVRYPNWQPASQKATKRQLQRLAKTSATLSAAIKELNKPAIDLLGLKPAALKGFQVTLSIINRNSAHADASGVPLDIGLGAPVKDDLRRMSTMIAQHYLGITGKRPTISVIDGVAGGEFIDLLSTVFEALEVRASPENMAREALKGMEKRVSDLGD